MRIQSIVFFIALTFTTPAAAQTGPQPDSRPPARIELEGTLDVPLNLSTGLPIVEARVNGQGPFRLGIETGANFIILTPDTVSKLGLTRTGGPDDLPAYNVQSIEIGPARFIDLPVSAMRFAQQGIDGVLGLPLYRDLLMTIDYPAARFRLSRGSLPEPDGQQVLPLKKVGPFWSLPVTLAGQRMDAILDTRSTGGIGLTPASAANVRFDGDLRVIGRARGAAIPETEVKAGKVAGDLVVGRYTVSAPSVAVRPLPPGFPTEPVLGSRLLRNFVVTLDQRNARLKLERSAEGAITLEEAPPAASPQTAAAPPDVQPLLGRFGSREIRYVDGKLLLQREGGPMLEMVAAGPDAYTLREVPQARIKFVRDAAGQVTAIQVLNREGQWETEQRTGR